MTTTPALMAARLQNLAEVPGHDSNPLIQGMTELVATEMRQQGLEHLTDVGFEDSVAWCSASAGAIAFFSGVERPSRHPDAAIRNLALRARSWLKVGQILTLEQATRGYDLAVFTRAGAPRDLSIINAPGHVAWYWGQDPGHVVVVGGNQSDRMSIARYGEGDLLAIVRVKELRNDA